MPLLLLPTASGLAVQSFTLSAVALLLLTAWLLLAAHDRFRHVTLSGSAAAMAAASYLVWLRGNSPQTLVLYTGVLAGVVAAGARWTPKASMRSLLDGIGLFLLVNVALYFVFGVRSPGELTRVDALEAPGLLFGTRIVFPLVYSLNALPALAAAFLAAANYGGRWKRRLPFSAAGVLVLLATNARAATIVTIAVFTAFTLRRNLALRAAPVLAVVGLLFPLLYLWGRPVLTPTLEVLTGRLPVVAARHSPGDVESLNGRAFIWQQSLHRMSQLPRERQLLGYGKDGHIKSGVSQTYESIFRSYRGDRILLTPHNSGLQQSLDAGLVGLALLGAAIVGVLARIAGAAARGETWVSSASAAVVALALAGATETLVVPNGLQTSFLVVASAVVLLGNLRNEAEADNGMERERPVPDQALRVPESTVAHS